MPASIVDVAGNVGLPLLFVVVAVETMGVPLPGETALISVGIVASQGKVSITAVIAVAAAAAILGDNVGFLLGRRYGRGLLTSERGPLKQQRREFLAKGEPFFEEHGPSAVFLGRLASGLRIFMAWMAGANRMRWPTFLVFNAAGGLAWATSIGLLAYVAGHDADKVGVAALGLAAVAIAVMLVRRHRAAAAPS